eukprot:TRINITY_DN35432_c0_g1_i1.p1 TRINITY_DN35432_c0_g1~~TRINITY_DN35432_c0_g1_i1.p1  ORF type:complete len:124 (+),score=11.87 TRINITY_DN35432_c0_g1_i1:51-374(+)
MPVLRLSSRGKAGGGHDAPVISHTYIIPPRGLNEGQQMNVDHSYVYGSANVRRVPSVANLSTRYTLEQPQQAAAPGGPVQPTPYRGKRGGFIAELPNGRRHAACAIM